MNRSAGALGAIVGGVALSVLGERSTLVGVAGLAALSVAIVGLSPMRSVRAG